MMRISYSLNAQTKVHGIFIKINLRLTENFSIIHIISGIY